MQSILSYIIKHKLIFFLVLIVLLLKINIINWGMPFSYHQDEQWFLIRSLHFLKGNLHPGAFFQPSLYHYINAFFLGLYSLFLLLFNEINSWETFIINNLFSYILTGRILNTIISSITIILFYETVKLLIKNKKLILIGTFLFSIDYLFFRESLYMTSEILLLFTTMLFVFSVYKKNKFLALLSLALAISTKYNAIFLFPVYVLAFLKKPYLKSFVKESFFCILPILLFLALNPFIIIDYTNFLKDISALPSDSSTLISMFANVFHRIMTYYLEQYIFLILPILYLSINFKKNITTQNKLLWVFLLFIIVNILFLARYSFFFPRYMIITLPFYYLISLIILDNLHTKNKNILISISILIAFSINIIKDINLIRIIKNGDTRNIATEFITKNIAPDSKIVIEGTFFGPRLNQAKQQLQEKITYGEKKRFSNYSLSRLHIEHNKNNIKYYLYYLNNSDNFITYYGSPSIKEESVFDKNNNYNFLVLNDTDAFFENIQDLDKSKIIFFINNYNKYSDLTGLPFSLKELLNKKFTGPSINIYKHN